MILTDHDMNIFVQQALATLLWSEIDEKGDPMDDTYDEDDIDEESKTAFIEECASFVTDNIADLANIEPSQAGHDFVLTRNGHGAGFWDRGLGEVGDRLTKASKAYGAAHLFHTDENTIAIC